jgi:hypothetical protein
MNVQPQEAKGRVEQSIGNHQKVMNILRKRNNSIDNLEGEQKEKNRKSISSMEDTKLTKNVGVVPNLITGQTMRNKQS